MNDDLSDTALRTRCLLDISADVGSSFKRKRDEIINSNKKISQFNIHSGRHFGNVNFNLPTCLLYRENGMTSERNISAQILKTKLKQLKLIYSGPVELSDHVNCYYVKSFKRGFVGAWSYQEYSSSIVKPVAFNHIEETSILDNTLPSIDQVIHSDLITLNSYKIFDLCGVTSNGLDYVLYVANSYSRCKNIARLQRINTGTWGRNLPPIRPLEHQEILWSCTWNDFSCSFALGADRCFYVQHDDNDPKKIDLHNGQPYSLDFSHSGDLLYCGLHMGNLVCFDQRLDSNDPAITIPLSKNISYIKLLSDQRTIITSGYNGVLFNVDVRVNKPVFQYPGHYSLYKKLIFSYNELHNILCASGEDNITRLWRLNDGKLVHAVPSPKQDWYGQINSCFESEGNRMFLHILLGDKLYTYETLEGGDEVHLNSKNIIRVNT